MLTNPNTLGLFESQIEELSEMLHSCGALLYLDGANLNALLGITRPGDAGCDLIHFNLHKTFSTPHGGGGPGSGPLGVKKPLEPYLPVPVVVRNEKGFRLDWDRPESIGKVQTFFGNFGVILKAYIYLRRLGACGLRQVAEDAILNANYLAQILKDHYQLPYSGPYMHEFVISGSELKRYGIRTLDVAKRLLDFGYHAPTIYFPLIVAEALMIEPTETESLETLDGFAQALIEIADEAKEDPERLKGAPYSTPVGRLDEARAARELDVRIRHP
jgi:glycine dehydrogenase subunit 2